jgi:hypothetical protein
MPGNENGPVQSRLTCSQMIIFGTLGLIALAILIGVVCSRSMSFHN